MNLVIVESLTKCKTLKKFLGKNYQIAATMGHIRDLPKGELGVDTEDNFKPKYVIPPKCRKIIKELKSYLSKSEKVILASVDYNEPVLIQGPDNLIHQFKVGVLINKILKENIDFSLLKIPAFDFKNQTIAFKSIKDVSRHPVKEELIEVMLVYGRKLKITTSHSVFTKNRNGKIKLVAGKDLKVGDKLLIPLKLPSVHQKIKEIDFLKAIYNNKELREKVFINSPAVTRYRREKVLSPKIGNIPQFQPRLILSSKLRSILKRKREELGWSQKFLADKINCSQCSICEWEKGKKNPILSSGKKYLKLLGFSFEKALKNPGAKLVPSSVEVAIRNALENQWRDSRKSLTHTWQPLSRFSWEEIEKNFKKDKELKISRHNHLHLMPRFISANKDLMLFLGFFIAEGSYLQNAVRFSFGKKKIGGEKENIERVKKISRRIFNLSPSDFEDRTSNSVMLNSSLVTFLLKNIFKIEGKSEKKEIPWIAYNVPQPLQFAFLEGLFLGDGSLNEANIVFNTVSLELAQGIRFLLLQNNILTSHSLAISKKPNRKPLHQIVISSKERLLKTKEIWKNHYKAGIIKKYLKRNTYIKKNFSLVESQKEDLGLLKIKSINKIKSSKDVVYDFSVEGENFICGDGGICAHNTDSDREGEAIAWHLSQALDLKKPERIVFHEITKSAIDQALKNPREIDMDLVDSQQARRILDRIVGYKLSPFLWKKVARRLSAGRVQSVTVRLVVEREREIKNFVPQEYWTIEALLKKQKRENRFSALLVKKDDKAIPKLGIKTKKETDKIVKDLDRVEYKVGKIEKKEMKRNPLPPFTTSTLQQESWKRFKFPARFTMGLAQQLYEKGFISYHRTDSLNLSNLSLFAAKKFIEKNFGKEYWAGFLRKYKAKGRVQEAHEAIRPTFAQKTPEEIKLEKNQQKLYDLIWRRFIACQMTSARFDSTTVEIEAKKYVFRATGQILKFDGFLKVYPMKFEENELPDLKEKEILDLIKLIPSQHFTQPPSRYSEATLIKALEQNGIGRPSTYAPTLSTIQERNYIEKNEQKKFCPTEIGIVVNDLLVKHFSKIVDIKFTAEMEEDLDEIAQGKEKWVEVCQDFYGPFEKNLRKKYQEVDKKDFTEKPTKKKCPKCGAFLVIRLGKFGRFYACPNFPKCKYTESLEEKTLGIKCPKCEKGKITEKRTKKGKIFYGCDQFPKCDFALWDKPTGEKCPKCGSLLVEKGKKIKCSNKNCQFKKNVVK